MQKINHIENLIDGIPDIRYNELRKLYRRIAMKRAVIKEALPLFTREVEVAQISMGREDYLFRIGLLRERMRRDGVDVALFFGDREHYGHMEYFSGYDCRFEEGILAIPVEGTPTIVCGNEGMSYSQIIPYAVNRVYYRNLSLQCQPRRAEEKLDEIFRAMGIGESSRVGVIGYKYFQPEYISTDPRYTFGQSGDGEQVREGE